MHSLYDNNTTTTATTATDMLTRNTTTKEVITSKKKKMMNIKKIMVSGRSILPMRSWYEFWSEGMENLFTTK